MGASNLDPKLSSSDSSSEDETGGLVARVEEDPAKVDFHFLKTGTAESWGGGEGGCGGSKYPRGDGHARPPCQVPSAWPGWGVYLSNSPYLNLSHRERRRNLKHSLRNWVLFENSIHNPNSILTVVEFDMKLTSHTTPLPPTTKICNTLVNTTLCQLYLGPVKPFT